MIKKTVFILVAVTLILSGCGTADSNVNSDSANAGISVEKGLLDVSITLPKDFVESSYQVEKDSDDYKTSVNEDGSITIKMTKAKHKSMMTEIKDSVISGFDEMTSSEGFEFIKKITPNNDFTKVDVIVEKEEYQNGFNSAITLGIGVSTILYQRLNGVSDGNLKSEINLIDSSTNQKFDTIVYPDALNNLEDSDDTEELNEY